MYSDKWQQVDCVANVFLATFNNRDTRGLRLSCELKEEVKPDKLQLALDRTVSEKDQFQVLIRSGLFWHFIEHSNIRPLVKEEDGVMCPLLYHPQKENELHYQVTWYKKRISFEAFHAICDGTGAMEFFNELLLNYLKLCYKDSFDQELSLPRRTKEELEEDSFRKYCGEETGAAGHSAKAYHLKGHRLPFDQLQYFDILIPLKGMLSKAKEHNTTLTVYLAALLVKTIVSDMPEKKREEHVNIAVPVNLRNYFPSGTARNFFVDVVLTHNYTGNETIENLAEELSLQLKELLEPEMMHARMNYYMKVQENVVVRAVPLFLKEKGLRFLTKKEDGNVTAVISNLGAIKVPDEMGRYIDHYCVYGSSENLFMAVSSFAEKLVINFISPYAETTVVRDFVRAISHDIEHVKVYATEVALR